MNFSSRRFLLDKDSSFLDVAVFQMNSIDDRQHNLNQIRAALRQIQSDCDLLILPENSLWMRLKEGAQVETFSLTDPIFAELSDWAKSKGVVIHLGSLPLVDEDKVANASVIISSEGILHRSYKKIHLFDIELTGQKPIRESDVFNGGVSPETFQINGWKIGQSICFDLRFSELFHHYANQGCDAVLVPSAFLPQTGKDHWEPLLRARAIESQYFILAPAQAGEHRSERGMRTTYGRSMVVDPWGRILTISTSDQPELLHVKLEKNEINRVRAQIPMRRRLK